MCLIRVIYVISACVHAMHCGMCMIQQVPTIGMRSTDEQIFGELVDLVFGTDIYQVDALLLM